MKWLIPNIDEIPDIRIGDLILCEYLDRGFFLFKFKSIRPGREGFYVDNPNNWEKGGTMVDFTDEKNCPFRYLIIPV